MAVNGLAQGQPVLELEILEEKLNQTAEEASGGVEIVYTPGDTIEYTLLVKNVGDDDMVDPEIVDPIPEGTAYVANSAQGTNSEIIFSINDGLQYREWPVMISETTEDGVQVGRRANPEQVTHVKWLIGETIAAGAQKELKLRVVVK